MFSYYENKAFFYGNVWVGRFPSYFQADPPVAAADGAFFNASDATVRPKEAGAKFMVV